MEHEYVENIAVELQVGIEDLHAVIERLEITTRQMGSPPYGVELSTAVSHRDADRLREYYAGNPRQEDRGAC